MASPEEIQFTKNRTTLQTALAECLTTAEICFGLSPIATSSNLKPIVGQLQGHTVAVQEMAHTRKYGELEIGYIIGSAPTWQPIVTITSTLADPQQFVLSPDMSGYGSVRDALVAALHAIKSS